VLYSSIELLQSSDRIKYEYYHDFESIFYFFLITCCTYDGPRGSRCKEYDVFADPHSAIRDWHEENTIPKRIFAGRRKRLGRWVLERIRARGLEARHAVFRRV
jgi:hypothetical protein